SARRCERLLEITERGLEDLDRRALALVQDRLRAIRIIEVQDRALRERRHAGMALRARLDRATRERMVGIAVDVNRATLEGGRDDRLRGATELERRRVVEDLARDVTVGAAAQRNDLFLLVATATRAGRETS